MTRFRFILTSLLLSFLLAACGPLEQLGWRQFHDGVSQSTPLHDGVTQTTPLVTGEVRLASGEPAANVSVTAYVSEYQIATVGQGANRLSVKTDAAGRFKLENPPLGMNTIEAEASIDSKAIRMNVPVSEGARLNLEPMTLQPTGAITGKVVAALPDAQMGTMVFIPGTHYLAITGPDGAYTLQHVPVGTYDVAAMRQTYATAILNGIQVDPKQTTKAPDLVLSLDAPVLESLSLPNGGAGTELVIRGRNFGATKNTVLAVKFGSTQASRFERISDTEIRVWVPEGSVNAPVTGPVVVISNGVASNALPFQVIAGLKLSPYYAGLYVGDRQEFAVEARDALGNLVTDPEVRWDLGLPSAGTLDARGHFSAAGEGWSEIWAMAGNLKAVGAVAVTAWSLPETSQSLLADSEITLSTIMMQPDETLLICDLKGHRIMRRESDGSLITLAGNGTQGTSPDGTLARNARLDSPTTAAIDAKGHLYFTETQASRVRVVPAFDTVLFGRAMTAGVLYTLAGTGERGFNGDGADARTRRLSTPRGIVLDPDGGVVFLDRANRRIRRISPDGALETLAGGGVNPYANQPIDALAFGDALNAHLARDASGNLVFASTGAFQGERIFMFCRTSGTYFGQVMTSGKVYALGGTDGKGFNGDGPALKTQISQSEDLDFLPDGDLVFIDAGGYLIRKLGRDGMIRTLAGRRMPLGVNGSALVSLPAPATSSEIGTGVLTVTRSGGLLIQPLINHLSLVELSRR